MHLSTLASMKEFSLRNKLSLLIWFVFWVSLSFSRVGGFAFAGVTFSRSTRFVCVTSTSEIRRILHKWFEWLNYDYRYSKNGQQPCPCWPASSAGFERRRRQPFSFESKEPSSKREGKNCERLLGFIDFALMFLILAVWEAMNDLKRRTRNMIEKRGFVPIYEQVWYLLL